MSCVFHKSFILVIKAIDLMVYCLNLSYENILREKYSYKQEFKCRYFKSSLVRL